MKTLKVKNGIDVALEIIRWAKEEGITHAQLNSKFPRLYRAYLNLRNQKDINLPQYVELIDRGYKITLYDN